MTDPDTPPSAALGQAYLDLLNQGEWQLDQPDLLDAPPAEEEATEPIPEAVAVATPVAEAAPVEEAPPGPVQILEALLFAGGEPLTAPRAASIVRGLTEEAFHRGIELLDRLYRVQNRPYHLVQREGGFLLVLRPRYRAIKERLLGGPKEARLTQPLLDVLAMVAYRQPVGQGEIDAVRGRDSSQATRQLLRLGLIALAQRASAKAEALYSTTPRFLELFGLRSLDELPRPGEARQLDDSWRLPPETGSKSK